MRRKPTCCNSLKQIENLTAILFSEGKKMSTYNFYPLQ